MKKLLVILSVLFCFNLSFGYTFLDLEKIEKDLPKFTNFETAPRNENFITGIADYPELNETIYISIEKFITDIVAGEYFKESVKNHQKYTENMEVKVLTADTAMLMRTHPDENNTYYTVKIIRKGPILIDVGFPTLLEGEMAYPINKNIASYFSKPFSKNFDYKTWLKDI